MRTVWIESEGNVYHCEPLHLVQPSFLRVFDHDARTHRDLPLVGLRIGYEPPAKEGARDNPVNQALRAGLITQAEADAYLAPAKEQLDITARIANEQLELLGRRAKEEGEGGATDTV